MRRPGSERVLGSARVGWVDVAEVVASRERAGAFVRSVRRQRGEPGRLRLVFAPSSGPRPRFLGPMPFRARDGASFLDLVGSPEIASRYYVRSLAALASPGADLEGQGLTIVAVLWPQPEVFVGSAVHLDAAASPAAWWALETTRLLAACSEPVQVQSVVTPRGRAVLSLWHDVKTRARRRAGPVTRAVDSVRTFRVVALGAGDGDGDARLDAHVRARMSEVGARHAQVAGVRGDGARWARAYTFGEEGYPAASPRSAMRLGSVAKVVTALVALRAMERLGVSMLDADVLGAEVLGISREAASALRVRDLLAHRAGLPHSHSIAGATWAPDRVARALGKEAASPGDLATLFRLRPGLLVAAAARRPRPVAYSNEGYVLLGEILSFIEEGRWDAYGALVEALLVEAGRSPRGGAFFAPDAAASQRRGESPPEPSSPTWALRRAESGGLRPRALPYADPGAYLGPAMGLCLPLADVVELVEALFARPRRLALASSELGWGRFDVPLLGFRRQTAGRARTDVADPLAPPSRVARLEHDGRVEGGAALLVHQFPLDADAPPRARLTVAFAMSRMGTLSFERDGASLLEHAAHAPTRRAAHDDAARPMSARSAS